MRSIRGILGLGVHNLDDIVHVARELEGHPFYVVLGLREKREVRHNLPSIYQVSAYATLPQERGEVILYTGTSNRNVLMGNFDTSSQRDGYVQAIKALKTAGKKLTIKNVAFRHDLRSLEVMKDLRGFI